METYYPTRKLRSWAPKYFRMLLSRSGIVPTDWSIIPRIHEKTTSSCWNSTLKFTIGSSLPPLSRILHCFHGSQRANVDPRNAKATPPEQHAFCVILLDPHVAGCQNPVCLAVHTPKKMNRMLFDRVSTHPIRSYWWLTHPHICIHLQKYFCDQHTYCCLRFDPLLFDVSSWLVLALCLDRCA